MLRIRDVYPGSRIPDPVFYPSRIPDLGSWIRIQKQQQKRGMKKICCHTFFCSNKFHITENYFILEMLKKKVWANFRRIKKKIFSKKSSQKYGFGIRDPEKTYSGSRGQKSTGSRIRTRNTGTTYDNFFDNLATEKQFIVNVPLQGSKPTNPGFFKLKILKTNKNSLQDRKEKKRGRTSRDNISWKRACLCVPCAQSRPPSGRPTCLSHSPDLQANRTYHKRR